MFKTTLKPTKIIQTNFEKSQGLECNTTSGVCIFNCTSADQCHGEHFNCPGDECIILCAGYVFFNKKKQKQSKIDVGMKHTKQNRNKKGSQSCMNAHINATMNTSVVMQCSGQSITVSLLLFVCVLNLL